MKSNEHYEICSKIKPSRPIEIEGEVFHSLRSLYEYAQRHGFNGSIHRLKCRIERGVDTIAELVAPVSEDKSEATLGTILKDRAEIADICRVLDERKAAIKAMMKDRK